MRAAHLRQRTVVGAPDPVPGLRHDPHRAWGSSASCVRRAPRSQSAGPSTSSVPRHQAFCRGDPGHAFGCPGTDPTQTLGGAPTEKRKRSAEICCLCRRVSRAGLGRLHVRAILGEQDTGQREFQTDPSRPRRYSQWGWPLGRGERCYGHFGDLGRRLVTLTAPCRGPTARGGPNTNGPRCQTWS